MKTKTAGTVAIHIRVAEADMRRINRLRLSMSPKPSLAAFVRWAVLLEVERAENRKAVTQ